MKEVFKSSELPHVWAHQKAPRGRCSSALSFEGNIIKSYSTHIACLHPKQNAVLFNDTRRSRTTAKNQTNIRRAIPGGMNTIYGPSSSVSNPEEFLLDLLNKAKDKMANMEEMQREHPRRKSQIAMLNAQALHMLGSARQVSDLFGLNVRCDMTKLEEMRQAEKERMEAARKAEEKRRKKAEKQAREQLKKWLNGESNETHLLPYGATFLRLMGGMVQTSKGITMEVEEAKAGLAFVFSKRHTGWRANGERYPIAGYHIDSVGSDGVVAGCHRLTWKELERFAKLVA